MFVSRRSLLVKFVGVAPILTLTPFLYSPIGGEASQTPVSPPQPRPSPNAPNNNYPPGLNGAQAAGPDQKAIDRANQKQLKDDIARLFQMTSDLKDQMDKTDLSSTLSLSVVKQAQAIEKLAKQIKELAKG